MRIKCDREELWAGFQMAATVAPSRSPKAILQSVKLEVSSESAELMATDMEIGIRVDVAGIEIENPGSAVFPVSRFGPILRESTDSRLDIDLDETNIIIKGQHSKFKLPAQNPDEFPSVPVFDENKYHEIPAKLLKELIRRTLFAADAESNRYALGGILLEFEEDKLIAVGTDGRRLAKMEGPAQAINGHESGDAMVIVPAKSMQVIERVVSDADAEIKIATRQNDVIIKTPRITLATRLVEGRFPRWRDVLPQRTDGQAIELTIGPTHSVLRQAAIVTSEDSRGVDFLFGHGTLQLATVTAEVGQSHVEMPIPYEGEEIKITLDHRFVADFFKVLDPASNFTVDVKDNESAALFTTDDGYGYVVMPLSRERK